MLAAREASPDSQFRLSNYVMGQPGASPSQLALLFTSGKDSASAFVSLSMMHANFTCLVPPASSPGDAQRQQENEAALRFAMATGIPLLDRPVSISAGSAGYDFPSLLA